MILYLHGFRSSPQSFKAQLIAQHMAASGRAAQYLCPQLPASPRAAIALALELVRDCASQQLALIGSSLGGYYATWLAQQLGCHAVLLNPAVKPPRDLEPYIGITTLYHSDQPFEFRREYLAELQEFAVASITMPERYFLVAATGDEVLDWREMTHHYAGARQHVIDGSDHGLSDFPCYIDEVMAFCLQSGGAG
jgi:uncharacterized protein